MFDAQAQRVLEKEKELNFAWDRLWWIPLCFLIEPENNI